VSALRLLRGKADAESTFAAIERLLAEARESLSPAEYRRLVDELLEALRREQTRTRPRSRLVAW